MNTCIYVCILVECIGGGEGGKNQEIQCEGGGKREERSKEGRETRR